MNSSRPAGSYGTDAAWVPWVWSALAALYIVLAVLSGSARDSPLGLTVLFWALALFFLSGAALHCNASWRGKFELWDVLLDSATPPSHVVDMGCGRGAVAITTALRFPTARVEGADLWRRIDQSGNSRAAAEDNAHRNGVHQRVRFTTADMTDMPFPDASADMVTASLAIHNIRSARDRAAAINEAWRVLKPGGLLLILDISKTREYTNRLVELGAGDVTTHNAGWRGWWTGPWMASRTVSATKPL